MKTIADSLTETTIFLLGGHGAPTAVPLAPTVIPLVPAVQLPSLDSKNGLNFSASSTSLAL